MSESLVPSDMSLTPIFNKSFVDSAGRWRGYFVIRHKDFTYTVFMGPFGISDLNNAKSFSDFHSKYLQFCKGNHLTLEELKALRP